MEGRVNPEDSNDLMSSCITGAGKPSRRPEAEELVFDESGKRHCGWQGRTADQRQTEDNAMRNSTPSDAPRWLTRGIVLLLVLVAANLLAWRSVEPDLWGHIQYGEDWLHSGQMPQTATHTYSTPDQPWVNHENLFELAVAIGQRTVGGLGLMIGKCLAGLWLLWTMVRTARKRQVPLMAAVVAMIPTAWGLSEFWLARPQLFSFVFFGLMLMAFERAFNGCGFSCRTGLQTRPDNESKARTGPQTRWLWMCVPLMTVWTNSHGGFLAGLCVLLAVLGLKSIELWIRRRKDSLRTIAEFAAIGAAALLSVFINPYGYELPYWMLVSLSQPRPEVSEWASIFDGGVTAIPFVVLTLLTVSSLWWTRRRRDWVEVIVLSLIAVQTLGHVRHLAFFAIAFGFWMPGHLVSLWHRMVEWRPTLGTNEELSATAVRWLKAEISFVAVLLVALLTHTFATFGVDRSKYPVDAVEFMARNNINGKLIVTFDWAQYALAALAPATTVGFDGRYDTCYPQTVVDMNFDLLFGSDLSRRYRGKDSGPADSNRVLEFGNPDLVLLDRIADVPGVEHLKQHPDWSVLYSDGRSMLWGRRSVFDDSASSRFFPADRRRISDDAPQGIAQWPGFPNRSGRDAFSLDKAAAVQPAIQISPLMTLR